MSISKENLNKLHPFLLLSLVNTKLRDEYDSLTDLCSDIGIGEQYIIDKLAEIGYHYKEKLNQFT